MARSREGQGLSKDTLGQALRRAAEELPRPKVSVGSITEVLEYHGQDKPVMAASEPHNGDRGNHVHWIELDEGYP